MYWRSGEHIEPAAEAHAPQARGHNPWIFRVPARPLHPIVAIALAQSIPNAAKVPSGSSVHSTGEAKEQPNHQVNSELYFVEKI